MSEIAEDRNLNWYARREPVVLVLLSVAAVLMFLAVAVLSRAYHLQQESRGLMWFDRGNADLNTKNYRSAVAEFRAALSYSRENYQYQLGLARALLGLDRTDEAYAYLINLLQREPDNGNVNLELGRIFAKKGDVNQAVRYYHNAIYAVWSEDSELQRRAARVELIDFLLSHQLQGQAESELMALASNLPDDPAHHAYAGDLFLKVPDYERALAEFEQALRRQNKNPAATAAAGRAAFELGLYTLAGRYLESAVSANPNDSQSAQLLDTVRLVLRMDPYRMRISAAGRRRVVMEAFKTAGDRLNSCAVQSHETHIGAGDGEETLETRWLQMKRRLSNQALRSDPELMDAAADLVFTIERTTSQSCGPPTGTDLALLLIANSREGNQ